MNISVSSFGFRVLSLLGTRAVGLWFTVLLCSFPYPMYAEPEPETRNSKSETELGRLFFTPEKRAALERQQELQILETSTIVVPDTVQINGYVKREGNSTLWINGVPQNKKDMRQMFKVIEDKTASEVKVIPSETEDPVKLKVGQTLDKSKRVITDDIAPGSITINKPLSVSEDRRQRTEDSQLGARSARTSPSSVLSPQSSGGARGRGEGKAPLK